MGMDVIGRSPVSERGQYFRNNIWWWHPLWNYCQLIAPDIIPSNNLGHTNDGWGLGHRASLKLAERLANALASGETAEYEKRYTAHLETLPKQICSICAGTGSRAHPPEVGPGPLPCNSCHGTGHTESFEKNYPFSVENVQEFEAFLRDCGGFSIC